MYLRYRPSVLEPAPGRTGLELLLVWNRLNVVLKIFGIWRGLNCELKYSITFVIISFQISAVVVIHN